MNKIIYPLLITLFFATNLPAQQFDLSAEIRPRYENKYGFQSLRNAGQDAADFISQRSRVTFDFKQDDMVFKLSLQNVRVWGDVSTLASDDNATALHEAWGEMVFSDKVSLKLGRQEIIYDDHRIFGNVGWAQQARSHDALLFKIRPNDKHKIDIGGAYNADNQSANDTIYSNVAGYKTFQYVRYEGKFGKLGMSFLALNTGSEFVENRGLPKEEEKIDFMQTIGPRFTYKSGNFSADAALYIQSGKSAGVNVSALFWGGNLAYKVQKYVTLGVGAEFLSGKDMDDAEADVKSFAPLFGTNHKFNGLMDYFYVGNHGGSVGLMDIYASVGFKKDKFSAKIVPHFFSAPANVVDSTGVLDNNLGVEVDFVMSYKISKAVSLKGGYSQMFATETMEAFKGGDSSITNSWGWLMITFSPKLFSYTAPKE